MTSDDYAYWRASLQGDYSAWTDYPSCGFFRRRVGKGGGYQPIAYFMRDGELVCLAGTREVPTWEHWGIASRFPTTEAAYRAKLLNGTPYADEYFVAGSDETTTDVAKAAPIGPLKRSTQNGHPTPKT